MKAGFMVILSWFVLDDGIYPIRFGWMKVFICFDKFDRKSHRLRNAFSVL